MPWRRSRPRLVCITLGSLGQPRVNVGLVVHVTGKHAVATWRVAVTAFMPVYRHEQHGEDAEKEEDEGESEGHGFSSAGAGWTSSPRTSSLSYGPQMPMVHPVNASCVRSTPCRKQIGRAS